MGEGVRGLAMRSVRVAAGAKDRLRPPPPGTTVLIYHRVGGRTPVPVDLPGAQFSDQMAAIAPLATTLDEALTRLANPSDPSNPADDAASAADHPVVVTFDDGTADVIEEALPILVEHQVPMLLYVATKFVEEGLDFPDDGKVVSWAALADGVSTGLLTIGSHTHSHALLDRLAPEAVDDELDRSIGLIQERLGVDPRHFAYPKALAGSPAADRAVRARFASAALAGTRINRPGHTDPWALARTPIQVRDGEDDFARKAAGGLGLEDDLRRLVNRVRYRGASS